MKKMPDLDMAVAYVNWLAGRPIVTAGDCTARIAGFIRFKLRTGTFRQGNMLSEFRDRIRATLGFAPTDGSMDSDPYYTWYLDDFWCTIHITHVKGSGLFIHLKDRREV